MLILKILTLNTDDYTPELHPEIMESSNELHSGCRKCTSTVQYCWDALPLQIEKCLIYNPDDTPHWVNNKPDPDANVTGLIGSYNKNVTGHLQKKLRDAPGESVYGNIILYSID